MFSLNNLPKLLNESLNQNKGHLRARMVGKHNGRDLVECFCQLANGDRRELLEWEYWRGEKRERWMWHGALSCACEGTGWVCAICNGTTWVSGNKSAEKCPQCTTTENVVVTDELNSRQIRALNWIRNEWWTSFVKDCRVPAQPKRDSFAPQVKQTEDKSRVFERKQYRKQVDDELLSEEIYSEGGALAGVWE